MNSRQYTFNKKNIAIFFVLLLLAGCDKENVTQTLNLDENDNNVQLESAGSKSEFEADIKTYFTQLLGDKNSGKQAIVNDEGGENRDINATITRVETVADGGSASVSMSNTNLIEAGIEEADLVKSDGRFLFIGRQGDNNNDWTIDGIITSDTLAVDT